MGSVIKDFYKSDAPQFKGRSKEKRREMAIAAKLEAERGPQNESATEKPMSPAELALQKRKALLDKQITAKRQMALNKTEVKEATYPSDFKKGSPVATKKTGRPIQHDQPTKGGRRKTVDEEAIQEDSRRMSNKQHTKRVRLNIKHHGSNYTPPRNYDPDANRGQGEVLTRKQIEKKRRKALRTEETEDSLRDRRMERGGVGGNQRYDRPYKAPNTKKFGTGKTMAQKEMEKKYGKGKSALDIVKAELEKKHGKGSVK